MRINNKLEIFQVILSLYFIAKNDKFLNYRGASFKCPNFPFREKSQDFHRE